MTSAQALIAKLKRRAGLDRRLDSEVTAYVEAPPGSRLDPVADIDGWAILAPGRAGESNDVWMTAADVPGLTASLDFVGELIDRTRPMDGAEMMARAFHRLTPAVSESPAVFTSRAARALLGELIRVIAAERSGEGDGARGPSVRDATALPQRAA